MYSVYNLVICFTILESESQISKERLIVKKRQKKQLKQLRRLKRRLLKKLLRRLLRLLRKKKEINRLKRRNPKRKKRNQPNQRMIYQRSNKQFISLLFRTLYILSCICFKYSFFNMSSSEVDLRKKE